MKLVRLPSLTFAAAAALCVAVAFAPVARTRADAQTAPPPPPMPLNVPSGLVITPAPPGDTGVTPLPIPSPVPSPTARRGKRGKNPDANASPAASAAPSPTATPTSPAYATLDGTWEVQIQYIDHTDYEFLDLTQQTSGSLAGTFRYNKTPFPLEGTYDGRLIRMVAKEPGGDVTLSGYVEGATDMVGLIDFGAGKGQPIAFTAEHRGPTTPSPRPRKK